MHSGATWKSQARRALVHLQVMSLRRRRAACQQHTEVEWRAQRGDEGHAWLLPPCTIHSFVSFRPSLCLSILYRECQLRQPRQLK